MNMGELSVRTSTLQVDDKGKLYVLCSMSDRSMWKCDTNGKNWERVKISDVELTEAFIVDQNEKNKKTKSQNEGRIDSGSKE